MLWEELVDGDVAGAVGDVQSTVGVVPVQTPRFTESMHHVQHVTKVRVQQHDLLVVTVQHQHEPTNRQPADNELFHDQLLLPISHCSAMSGVL